MSRYLLFCIALTVFCINGCGGDFDSSRYIRWIEDPDNGLVIQNTLDSIQYRLQFKPADYIVCKEQGYRQSYEDSAFSGIYELNNLYHFNLMISTIKGDVDALKASITENQQYQDRLDYFSYQAQDDFRLVVDKDTFSCVLYHFERSYNLSPINTLVLGFENKQLKNANPSDLVVLFRDRIWANGTIKFRIKGSDIGNIPQLYVHDVSDVR